MPIIKNEDVERIERAPGVMRWERVNEERGARGLIVGELEFAPGSSMPPHVHPNEEAMLITAGTLEAIWGDETHIVEVGDVVLAPAGIKHTFANRSSEPGRVVFIHPVLEIVTEAAD